MKKLLLIPALLSATLTLATEYNYELSPIIGYNFAEGNLGIKNDGHALGALEMQFNTPESKISPEFSLLYSPKVKYENGGNTRFVRGAFNGVYNFDKQGYIVPFTKLGVGIERISDENRHNKTGFFADAGVGVKVPFTDNLSMKLEALYMAKIAKHNSIADSNLVTMLGLTYAFGKQPEEKKPLQEDTVREEVVVVVVDGDDDNDGVLNSQDSCLETRAGVKVDALGCPAVLDSDKDGVSDSYDRCPNTPQGDKVDSVGCTINLDIDNDGVLNDKDICPNTVSGEAVNSDGCAKTVTLQITFKSASADIEANSAPAINEYADFLTTYTNYSAKIVGYTDNTGSKKLNEKLSQERANQVRALLIDRGVNPNQVTALGLGSANPVADNATAEGRAKNRRIEAELTRN